MQKTAMMKICIFGHDCIAVVCSVCPHPGIRDRLQAEFPNVSQPWISFGESLSQCRREVLIQQQLHAGTEIRRRSRSAAKAMHARRSSRVRSGKKKTPRTLRRA